MVLFHFRVHTDNLDLEKLTGFIKSNSSAMLIVKEVGDRPHIHCVITPTKTPSTFRQKFLKTFEMCKGNRCYSFEEVKDEEHIKAYICKGEENKQPDVIFSTIDTSMYHKKYWEVNNQLKTNPQTGKVKKDRVLNWIQDVKKQFVEQFPCEINVLANPVECMWKPTEAEEARYVVAKKELLGFIFLKLGSSVRILDDSIVSRIFKGIQNSIIQEGANRKQFTNYMYDKLSL